MSGASPPTGGVSLLALQGEPNSFDELRELYDLTTDDLNLFYKQLYDPIRNYKFPVDMAWIRMGCKIPSTLNGKLNHNDVMHILKTCKRLTEMKETNMTAAKKRKERMRQMGLSDEVCDPNAQEVLIFWNGIGVLLCSCTYCLFFCFSYIRKT